MLFAPNKIMIYIYIYIHTHQIGVYLSKKLAGDKIQVYLYPFGPILGSHFNFTLLIFLVPRVISDIHVYLTVACK